MLQSTQSVPEPQQNASELNFNRDHLENANKVARLHEDSER